MMKLGYVLLQPTQDMIHPIVQFIHIVQTTHQLVTQSSLLSDQHLEYHTAYVQVILISFNNGPTVQIFIQHIVLIALFYIIIANILLHLIYKLNFIISMQKFIEKKQYSTGFSTIHIFRYSLGILELAPPWIVQTTIDCYH